MAEPEEVKPKLPLKTRVKRFFRLDSPPRVWELQVFYKAGGRTYGWHTIWKTDAFKPKMLDVSDRFEPGKRYRVIRRNVETGRYDKICWNHYESAGSEMIEGAEEKIEEKVSRRREHVPTPSEVMTNWAEQVKEVLAPFQILGSVRQDIMAAFGSEGGGGGQQMPPLSFSGSAPWFMHPYVVKYTGETMKDLVGYTFDRVEKITKQMGIAEEGGGAEIEEVTLPRPSQFLPSQPSENVEATPTPMKTEVPKPEEPVLPVEEVTEVKPEKLRKRGKKTGE